MTYFVHVHRTLLAYYLVYIYTCASLYTFIVFICDPEIKHLMTDMERKKEKKIVQGKTTDTYVDMLKEWSRLYNIRNGDFL